MINPFGKVFSDNIIKENKRSRLNATDYDNGPTLYLRLIFLGVLLLFGLGLLFARMFGVTIIEGDRYRKLSSSNMIKEENIISPRGIIYDRNKKPLVRNIPVFKYQNNNLYFEQKPTTVSGEPKESITREYIYGDVTAHVLGYIGEVSTDDIKERRMLGNDFRPGDIIGKEGLEKVYDNILRGKNGQEMIEVDAAGEEVRVLGKMEPKSGQNINISLDIDLQKASYDAIGTNKGAVIVENPKNGEILALYSSPSYDPNRFIKSDDVSPFFTDQNQPLFNRSIGGEYPPGSTFKIVTSLAALEKGTINSGTQIEDTGVLTVGSFSFSNWYFSQYGKKEGMLNIVGATKRSNDIFFYKVGEMTGIESIAKMAKNIGVGSKLGIDLPGEVAGLMPDSDWMKKVKGENWYTGNTYHVAIGQGDILTTPLQVNALVNVVANNGKLCQPHLLTSQNPGIKINKTICRDLGIKKENLELVKEGMKEACSTGGTGWPLFNFKIQNARLKIDNQNYFESYESTTSGKPFINIPVACKTVTAEFGDQKKTHAWITVFAPIENPQISITVLVESGGEGSTVAGPIAKKILEYWFSK